MSSWPTASGVVSTKGAGIGSSMLAVALTGWLVAVGTSVAEDKVVVGVVLNYR